MQVPRPRPALPNKILEVGERELHLCSNPRIIFIPPKD